MRKVLQFDAESTPVLSGKYWSTDRIVLAIESESTGNNIWDKKAPIPYLRDRSLSLVYNFRCLPKRNQDTIT